MTQNKIGSVSLPAMSKIATDRVGDSAMNAYVDKMNIKQDFEIKLPKPRSSLNF